METPNVGIGIYVQIHITMHTYGVCPQIMNQSIMGMFVKWNSLCFLQILIENDKYGKGSPIFFKLFFNMAKTFAIPSFLQTLM